MSDPTTPVPAAEPAPAPAPAPDAGVPAPDQPAGDAAELQALREQAQRFAQIKARAEKDPVFRQQFEQAWEGKRAAVDAAVQAPSDPMEVLRTELRDTQEKLSRMEQGLEWRDVAGARSQNDYTYGTAFNRLAESEGYDVDSPAYRALHSEVKDNMVKLAKKYGVTDGQGNPDPTAKFHPELLKEAFGQAMKTHEDAGFKEAWSAKREAIRMQQEMNRPDPLADLFVPEKLKTREQRAAAVREAMRRKYPTMSFR